MQDTRLVILSDYGLDDAVAAVFLIRYFKRFKAVDVFAVSGNVDAETSLANALALFDAAGVRDVNIYSTGNIAQKHFCYPHIHGKDGMGDVLAKTDVKLHSRAFGDWYKDAGGEPISILSLGPCTVTQVILENIDHKRVRDLYIMAGTVYEKPNHEGLEFNQALDPAAFKYCVSLPQARAVTLDTCRQPCFNFAGFHAEGESLLAKLLNRSIILAEARHPDNAYPYDLVAAICTVKPEAFIFSQAILPDGFTFTMAEGGPEFEEVIALLEKRA